ncbi:MAG TPA: glycoside hydrolase family 15 protein [Candidatus Thermoplasmatota archaeon]|nr:glycoside hydrolase family 15 protein [Candidatus Thermoplasmatota archaeon]
MISLLSGNQRVLLTIDERGAWTQLYYPHPGMHQQLQQARVGLYDEATKAFTWVDHEGEMPDEMQFLEDSNAARTRLRRMGLEVTLDDIVHPNLDLVIRRIAIRNPGTHARRVRVFRYQSLNIGGSMYQDTAYWDPETRTVTHYKGNFYFQMSGKPDFDHYSCGEHTLKGLKGSYVDAEDGQLSGGGISHGAADSVVQWNLEVPAGQEKAVHLMMVIGSSRRQVTEATKGLAGRDPSLYIAETIGYGNHWARKKQSTLAADLSPQVANVYRRSLYVLHDCQAANGSIIASPDSRTLKWGGDTYTYNWWRDGAYICRAMSEAGLHHNALAFLGFAARCQEEDGSFLHRHLPDGALGSTWHPPPFLQVDQTASVLDAVWHHYEVSGDLDELLRSWQLVRKGADFLMGFVDEHGLPRPSYDLWEEKKNINTYTVAAVVAGLRAAAKVGRALAKRSDFWTQAADRMQAAALERLWNPVKGTFNKGINPLDEAVDASTLLALRCGLLEPSDPRYAQVVEAVEKRLWSKAHGGISRYESDQYYGRENPWIICTLWLAQCHLALGNKDRCRELIEWAAATAGPTHLLAEQIDAEGEHTSVTPLVWSHSTFIEAVNDYTRTAQVTAVPHGQVTLTVERPAQ